MCLVDPPTSPISPSHCPRCFLSSPRLQLLSLPGPPKQPEILAPKKDASSSSTANSTPHTLPSPGWMTLSKPLQAQKSTRPHLEQGSARRCRGNEHPDLAEVASGSRPRSPQGSRVWGTWAPGPPGQGGRKVWRRDTGSSASAQSTPHRSHSPAVGPADAWLPRACRDRGGHRCVVCRAPTVFPQRPRLAEKSGRSGRLICVKAPAAGPVTANQISQAPQSVSVSLAEFSGLDGGGGSRLCCFTVGPPRVGWTGAGGLAAAAIRRGRGKPCRGDRFISPNSLPGPGTLMRQPSSQSRRRSLSRSSATLTFAAKGQNQPDCVLAVASSFRARWTPCQLDSEVQKTPVARVADSY